MKSLPVEAKLKIIKRVQNGEKVAKVCTEAGISRKTFYKWLLKFKSSKPHLAHVKLADKRFKHVFKFKTLPSEQKLLLVNQALAGFGSVSEICRNFGVSRKTFYKWFRRYKEESDDGLFDLRPKGEKHYRAIPQQLKNQVISAVAANPEFSVHQLSKTFVGTVGHHGIQNILAQEGLNTYPARLEHAKRWTTAQPGVEVAPLYQPEIPMYRLRMLLAPFTTVPKLIVTNPAKGLLLLALLTSPFFLLIFWTRILLFAQTGSSLGLFFASVALFFGLFFFIYSMKYYIAVLMVLRLAQSGAVAGDSSKFLPSVILSVAKNLVLRSFGIDPQDYMRRNSRVNPLNINLEKVELDGDKRPFVSIHVAVYNEKRVVERLIKACTSQEWIKSGVEPQKETNDLGVQPLKEREANYEVVIADDSTDETMEIAKEVLLSMDYSVARERYDPPSPEATEGQGGLEIFRFGPPPDLHLPIVKIIHRFARSGFKGGALQKALENTDARAQYIMVFDADFVPYPDTIEQFVKTFQVLSPIEPINADLTDSAKSAPNQSNQRSSRIAAVQGYQWHVLNKSQTWVTRGVRTEYAGSYVIERSGEEIYGGLKQIAGSVYAIRADILRQFGWGTSITEDFELTLRLYEAGYKVVFTPYIQAPAEAVSTIKRLIRQRMRWAEGASFNVKIMLSRMLWGHWEEATANSSTPGVKEPYTPGVSLGGEDKVWVPSRLTLAEKLEFAYLAPYYLQAAFFVVGTFCWFISETVFNARLPFWTAAFGWSLVFTNLLALPLMNIIGMFLEESDERDYLGILSFIALSYIVVPFQAYAAIKGFLEKEEGPWFRTPKTGVVTDVFGRSSFGKFFGNIFGGSATAGSHPGVATTTIGSRDSIATLQNDNGSLAFAKSDLAFVSAYNVFSGRLPIKPRQARYIGNLALGVIISVTVLMSVFAPLIPSTTSYASQPTLKTVNQTEDSSTEVSNDEITTPRAIKKTTKGGGNVEFIFHKEPRVRIKLSGPASAEGFGPLRSEASEVNEVEFETKEVFGQRANPTKATIYQDKEVIYEEIIPNVDLKYSITNDLLVEEFILKEPIEPINADLAESVKSALNQRQSALSVEQTVKTVDVKVVSPDPTAFGFYSQDCGTDSSTPGVKELSTPGVSLSPCQELFRLSAPFAKDADGEVSSDITVTLDKHFDFAGGYRLTKTLGQSAKEWLNDPLRAYPVSIDPSVIVSGGIVEAEVQFGGLQRKVVYMPGAVTPAWYAFASDANDASYYRSTDGTTWSAVQDLDTGDADNFNPSISVSGNFIIVFWVDDSGETVEGRRFDTTSAFPHTLGTLCTGNNQGTLGSTFMVTVAAFSVTEAVVAFSDTSTDTEFNVFDVTGLDATCAAASFTTDLTPSNVVFGSGITAGDRPVVVPLSSEKVAMIFQDGDLSYSEIDIDSDDWTKNNLTIASVTDSVYAVTTDQAATPTVWVLTVSGTTATNFYSCCTVDITETQIDSDTGGNGNDAIGGSAMFCPASSNCKIAYLDDQDTTAPKLIFLDCNDETCSAPTITTLDADIGGSGAAASGAGPGIYCVDDGDGVVSDNCKISYVDDKDTSAPDLKLIDCTNDEDCSTNSIGTIDTDAGDSIAGNMTIVDCPSDTNCKILYSDPTGPIDLNVDLRFVDCSNAACSTQDAITAIDTSVGLVSRIGMDCSAASTDCKAVYHDKPLGELHFVDCPNEACSSSTITTIDTAVGTGTGQVQPSIDCVGGAADCKVIYNDDSSSDLVFVDCSAVACSTTDAITTVDSTGGANGTTSIHLDMDCVSATDCKFIYMGDTTSGSENQYFVDCDNAACSSGSAFEMPGPRWGRGVVICLTSANCKTQYYEGTASTNPTVQFADCDVTNCFPSSTDQSPNVPWTGEINLTSVSLTYDSTNSDLYAHVIMDTSEQAYFKSTDAATISWTPTGDGTSYAFTAGDLGHVSAPESSAGTTGIGVVLRQGTNFEFAVVPERMLFLLGVVPFLPKLWEKWKGKRKYR